MLMCPSSDRTVLLVDDDQGVRTLLHQVLTSAAYHVLLANDGLDALQLADHHAGTVDLLVTDLKMPKMQGVELARSLVQKYPSLRIVFISGSTGAEVFPSAAEFPNHVFLQKPFSPSDLLDRIAKLFGNAV